MRRSFVSNILLGFLLAGAACTGTGVDAADKGQAQKCYPEALSDDDKKLNFAVPCAPSNYIYTPLDPVQKFVQRDRDHIWPNDLLTDLRGSWIWEKTIDLPKQELTVSMANGGSACAAATCPVRIRLQKEDGAIVIKQVRGNGQVCGSPKYIFVKNTFDEVLACGLRYPLVTLKAVSE